MCNCNSWQVNLCFRDCNKTMKIANKNLRAEIQKSLG